MRLIELFLHYLLNLFLASSQQYLGFIDGMFQIRIFLDLLNNCVMQLGLDSTFLCFLWWFKLVFLITVKYQNRVFSMYHPLFLLLLLLFLYAEMGLHLLTSNFAIWLLRLTFISLKSLSNFQISLSASLIQFIDGYYFYNEKSHSKKIYNFKCKWMFGHASKIHSYYHHYLISTQHSLIYFNYDMALSII